MEPFHLLILFRHHSQLIFEKELTSRLGFGGVRSEPPTPTPPPPIIAVETRGDYDGVEALAVVAFTRSRSRLRDGDDLTGRRRAHRGKEPLVRVALLKDTSARRF